MKTKTIEKIWVIFIIIWVSVLCFGALYHNIYGPEKFNMMPMNWVLNCFLIGIPPNALFFALAAYSKK
jgi:RsiW-degrading membrane proteinase PrsW (M82 family)